MAAALNSSPVASSFSPSKPFNNRRPFLPPLSLNLVRPLSNPTRISSLWIGHHTWLAPKCALNSSIAAMLEDGNSELSSDLEPPSPSASLTDATFDIKLPRRSLIVNFTCNACGERTQRTINRLAYERGTVFVQCSGCLQHHKLVDNLGLIVEYDLRQDVDADSSSDVNQV